MSEQSNLQVVKEAYAAFGRGDLPALLSSLTEDVEWVSPGTAELPTAGTYRGRDQVAKFFALVSETFEIEQFEPGDFVAQGDKVAVFGHERGRVKSTGRAYQIDWAHLMTLRDGKIARFQDYWDTAAVLAAALG